MESKYNLGTICISDNYKSSERNVNFNIYLLYEYFQIMVQVHTSPVECHNFINIQKYIIYLMHNFNLNVY